MRHFAYPGLAGAGVLLLILGVAQTAQTHPAAIASSTTETANQSQTNLDSPTSGPNLVLPAPDKKCQDFDGCLQQFEAQIRSIQKEVDTLPDPGRLREEVEMSSPELSELSGLSAKLQAKGDDLASHAEELSAQAAPLAQKAQREAEEIQKKAQEKIQEAQKDIQESTDRVFAMSPGVFVSSSDEGGWLGVEIGEVTAEKAKDLKLSEVRGVIVEDVELDSPAAKAGIKEKDVITQYDGQPVEGTVQFRRLVRETPPGRTITLAISRGGSTQNVSVELGDRSDYFVKKMKGKMRDFGEAYSFSMPNFNVEIPEMPDVMDARTPVLGINAEDLTGQLGSYFGAPDGAGVLVREVRPGTPAATAGLKAGDVIFKVNEKPVRTLAELRAQLREKSDQVSVRMDVIRKGSNLKVTVPIERPRPAQQVQSFHRAQL
jgi:serine protease Do